MVSLVEIWDNVVKWDFHYLIGMGLCGLGWHLCFSSASLMLDATHTIHEATRVQAANDFMVYITSAAASLARHSAGPLHRRPVLHGALESFIGLLVPGAAGLLVCPAFGKRNTSPPPGLVLRPAHGVGRVSQAEPGGL